MTLLWAVPPVAVALAGVLLLLHLRRITESVVAVRDELGRLAEVQSAAEDVRLAVLQTQQRVRALRG